MMGEEKKGSPWSWGAAACGGILAAPVLAIVIVEIMGIGPQLLDQVADLIFGVLTCGGLVLGPLSIAFAIAAYKGREKMRRVAIAGAIVGGLVIGFLVLAFVRGRMM